MILILIWELVYKIGAENLKLVKANDFPDPYNVLKTLTALIKDNTLIIAVATSLIRLLIGYIIALVLGIVIGISIISFKFLDDNLSPLILGLQTLPNVCWIPLATLWFGLNEKSHYFCGSYRFGFCYSNSYRVRNKKRKSNLFKGRKNNGCKRINLV